MQNVSNSTQLIKKTNVSKVTLDETIINVLLDDMLGWFDIKSNTFEIDKLLSGTKAKANELAKNIGNVASTDILDLTNLLARTSLLLTMLEQAGDNVDLMTTTDIHSTYKHITSVMREPNNIGTVTDKDWFYTTLKSVLEEIPTHDYNPIRVITAIELANNLTQLPNNNGLQPQPMFQQQQPFSNNVTEPANTIGNTIAYLLVNALSGFKQKSNNPVQQFMNGMMNSMNSGMYPQQQPMQQPMQPSFQQYGHPYNGQR